MRDITCPADLDRLPACPSCRQLQRDLAEARGERDYAVRSAFKARERAHCLKADLAAARGERDRLREALERALRLCGRCGGTGRQWASATFDEAGKMTKAYKPCPDCTPFRAALEKANG